MTHPAPSIQSSSSNSIPLRRRTGSLKLPRSVRRAFAFVIDVMHEANQLRRSLRRQNLVPEA